jgi:tetrahydromethanopterin S-methyltransferase subunit A
MVTGPARDGPVAVCTLTSAELDRPLGALPGVARAGGLVTANLGIEELLRWLLDRPRVRFLLLCGTDSALFQAGQTLVALARNGVAGSGCRVVGGAGYLPMLATLGRDPVQRFRDQVELVDARGERDAGRLAGLVAGLVARDPGPYRSPVPQPGAPRPAFRRLRPGGRRRPIARWSDTFVVVDVDRTGRRLTARVYGTDLTPRYEMAGARAESMLLGLLEAGVVTDLSHAGYLGAELAKAETALRLGLDYHQDLPLRAAYSTTVPR